MYVADIEDFVKVIGSQKRRQKPKTLRIWLVRSTTWHRGAHKWLPRKLMICSKLDSEATRLEIK